MDPLSIAASLIAVLGALTASGKGLNKLFSLRKAHAELYMLMNEVEALRGLLIIVYTSLRLINSSAAYLNNREAFCLLLKTVEDSVFELQRKIDQILQRSEEGNRAGSLKFSRSGWLKAGPEIERMRQRIRDARGNLEAALSAMNLQVNETVRQTTMQIQTVSVVSANTIQQHLEQDSEQQSTTNQSIPKDQTESGRLSTQFTRLQVANRSDVPGGIGRQTAPPSYSDHESMIPSSSSSTLRKPDTEVVLHNEYHPETNSPDTIVVETTITLQKCPKQCKCQCHTRSYVRTSRRLLSALGQLFFDYTPFVHVKPCSHSSCHQGPWKHQFIYFFPKWLAARALIATYVTDSMMGSGARVAIKMPIILPAKASAWQAIVHGDISHLQDSFSSGRTTPHMIDPGGWNMLHWAVASHQKEIYKSILEQGVDQDY